MGISSVDSSIPHLSALFTASIPSYSKHDTSMSARILTAWDCNFLWICVRRTDLVSSSRLHSSSMLWSLWEKNHSTHIKKTSKPLLMTTMIGFNFFKFINMGTVMALMYSIPRIYNNHTSKSPNLHNSLFEDIICTCLLLVLFLKVPGSLLVELLHLLLLCVPQ